MLSPEYKAKLREQAYDDDLEEELEEAEEYRLDLNNLPKVEHNWVKRGDVVSCEGANHPYHRHFLHKRSDTASTN